MKDLKEHECAAWMVAYMSARMERFASGSMRGPQMNKGAAIDADEAIEVMRSRTSDRLPKE